MTVEFIVVGGHRPCSCWILSSVFCLELVELGQMSLRYPVEKTRELFTGQPVQGAEATESIRVGKGPLPVHKSLLLGNPESWQFYAKGWEGTEAAGLFLTQCTGSWEQLGFLLFKGLNCWNLTHPLIMLPKMVVNVDQGSFSWYREMWGCRERPQGKGPIF